jgi:hypothetical protein
MAYPARKIFGSNVRLKRIAGWLIGIFRTQSTVFASLTDPLLRAYAKAEEGERPK